MHVQLNGGKESIKLYHNSNTLAWKSSFRLLLGASLIKSLYGASSDGRSFFKRSILYMPEPYCSIAHSCLFIITNKKSMHTQTQSELDNTICQITNFVGLNSFKQLSFHFGMEFLPLVRPLVRSLVLFDLLQSNMSSSRSSSTSSNDSWMGLQPDPKLSTTARKLKSTFNFDDCKEFSDLRIFSMQGTRRFYSLQDLLKFPCQPFYSSIFSVFNCKHVGYRPERFLQRRICLNFCNWNPSRCFLADSHSGNLEDLGKQEFHNLYNPEFESQFNKGNKGCKLPFDKRNPISNLNNFVGKLGITSTLSYENGKAFNIEYLIKEYRNRDHPFYVLEGKKCLDIVEALLEASKYQIENHKQEMDKMYQNSLICSGAVSKPILSLMMWGPQPHNNFPASVQPCRLEIDHDNRLVLEEKLHKCKNFVEKHYWMFSHGDEVICKEGKMGNITGPVMSEELTVLYPCNKGKCSLDCKCELCENTRSKSCPLKHHKKHLAKFDRKCPIQIASQCQEHWVSHPDNFDTDEDILVEKNVFFHNQKLVDQPRSCAVEIIKFAGIKKSCITCRRNVQNHFEKHMDYHLQCKFCLFQLATLEDVGFWRKVCNICGKIMSSFSLKQMNWHKKVHEETEEFKCSLCDLVLKRKSTFVRHLKEIHNKDFKEECIVDRILNNFDDEPHSGDTDVSETVSEDSEEDYLISTFKATDENLQCGLCGKQFRLQRYLEMHTKYNHGVNCPFKCEECGAQYIYKGDLKRHKTTAHEVIEDKYTFPGDEGNKTFSCQTCSKVFKRKDLLKKHLVTHNQTKEKISCELCGKKYGRKDHLKDHIKLIHLNTEISYSCELCGKKFNKKSNLERHMTVLHNL